MNPATSRLKNIKMVIDRLHSSRFIKVHKNCLPDSPFSKPWPVSSINCHLLCDVHGSMAPAASPFCTD
jgi:hypothetical protein